MTFRPDPILCLALLLAGCGPGSGGSGVPSGLGEAPVSSAPAPVAPAPEPPPASTPVAPPVSSCDAPVSAGADVYQGQIQAIGGGCLIVAGRAIVIDGAILVRRSGAGARLDELQPGIRVTIEPVSGNPGRARLVVIEDLAG